MRRSSAVVLVLVLVATASLVVPAQAHNATHECRYTSQFHHWHGTSGDDNFDQPDRLAQLCLDGLAGNDNLDGNGYADQLFGRNGNDILEADAGRDTVVGGNGNDKVAGGDGNDDLYDGPGADNILGGPGSVDVWLNCPGDSGDTVQAVEYVFTSEEHCDGLQ